MKHFDSCPLVMVFAAVLLLPLASCDQVSNLVDQAKGLVSDDDGPGGDRNATVDKVDEQQARAVMAQEARLVMVEFYTDT